MLSTSKDGRTCHVTFCLEYVLCVHKVDEVCFYFYYKVRYLQLFAEVLTMMYVLLFQRVGTLQISSSCYTVITRHASDKEVFDIYWLPFNLKITGFLRTHASKRAALYKSTRFNRAVHTTLFTFKAICSAVLWGSDHGRSITDFIWLLK